jgi:hypothetical protein
MKNLVSGVAGFAFAMTCFIAPLGVDYTLYGIRKNGHVIYRYPDQTRLVSDKSNPTYCLHIVDDNNDCVPDFRVVTAPSHYGGIYSESKLRPEDYREWELAMN